MLWTLCLVLSIPDFPEFLGIGTLFTSPLYSDQKDVIYIRILVVSLLLMQNSMIGVHSPVKAT